MITFTCFTLCVYPLFCFTPCFFHPCFNYHPASTPPFPVKDSWCFTGVITLPTAWLMTNPSKLPYICIVLIPKTLDNSKNWKIIFKIAFLVRYSILVSRRVVLHLSPLRIRGVFTNHFENSGRFRQLLSQLQQGPVEGCHRVGWLAAGAHPLYSRRP